METSRYRAFLAAADSGSFTKAAKLLNYSPSGVSQLITAIETELGFTLFNRCKKGVSLTVNGEKLIPIVRELLYQEECIYQIATDINGLVSGDVRIATYSSIAGNWLPEVIKDFKTDYPGVNITLMEGVKSEIVAQLEERKADMAFVSRLDSTDYDWAHLDDNPMIAALPKSHPLAGCKSYPIANCINEDMIIPALGYDEDLTAIFTRYNIKPSIQYRSIECFAAMSMIEKGLGISIMNELITRNYKCDIVKIPLYPAEKIELGIAVPSLEKASPAVRKFFEYAVKHLKRI